jgi:hypothetical protein
MPYVGAESGSYSLARIADLSQPPAMPENLAARLADAIAAESARRAAADCDGEQVGS